MQTAQSPIHRLFDHAFNEGELAVVDELVTADAITHATSWGLPNNRTGLKQLILAFRTAFPDLHCIVQEEIAQGDRTAVHWTMRGTHQGAFMGNRPTGRPIRVQGIIIVRVVDGRIVENWILIDQMSILQQLGIIPPPGH
jgi:steroid delta-isomerase-like uncharacterized protein